MTAAVSCRAVARIDSPPLRQGLTAQHRARPLVAPGDWAATDPFLLMMEDWFPKGVFDRHPHRGFETVTFLLEGGLDHYDNHGNRGRIGAGDALWLTAGRGLIHNEEPMGGQPVHLLQLWVNLPRASKLVPARFQELRAADMPVLEQSGARLRVFSGTSGAVTADTLNYTPVTMLEALLEPAARVEHELPAGHNAFVVVLEGECTIGTPPVSAKAGQVAWLTPSEAASRVVLTAGEHRLRAVLLSGQPLGEPVAAAGPFVMNTEAELKESFAQFHAQGERFGL